jgi:hypothetical protein
MLDFSADCEMDSIWIHRHRHDPIVRSSILAIRAAHLINNVTETWIDLDNMLLDEHEILLLEFPRDLQPGIF